jgi:hypothetical protein
MAYDGIIRPKEKYHRADMLYGINAVMADQRSQYVEEVPDQHEENRPEHLASDFAIIPEQGEAHESISPKVIPSPVAQINQALLPSLTQKNQPLEDERGLSVFKSRKMPRSIPQLTRPALLGPQPGGAVQSSPSSVVPPVVPVSVPTPVSMIRPGAPEFPASLNLPPRDDVLKPGGQITAIVDGGDIGERSNDPSPTKTERLRKVARWAREAATAPPPLINEAQNDSQEAALRRDGDRLDIAAESPSTPPQFGRQLPSTPHAASQYAQTLHRGLATFEDPDGVLPTHRIPDNDDCRSSVPADHPMEERNPTADEKELTPQRIQQDREPVLPTEALQQLQSIHGTVQALHRSHESSQLDGTYEEAVMANTDESKEILAKTNVLLEMISAIHERLAERSTIGGISPVATGNDAEPFPDCGAEKVAEGLEPLEPYIQAPTTTLPSRELELGGILHPGEDTVSTEKQQVSASEDVASRASTK